MASTINASTASTTGLVQTADASGILQLQGNSNTGLTVGTTGNVTVNTNLSFADSTIMATANSLGTRNRLINGAMMIDQRNAGAAQTITAAAALAYTVDRWYAYCTGANVTGQRVAGSGNNLYAYRFTGAASVTAIGFGQRIESFNSADLAGTTATLSVDLANTLLTTVTWTAFYANTADTFGTLASPTRTQIATGTFTVTSSLTRYSTNISIPAAATTGIEIVFTVGAQTSGTWTVGNVQLEAGSVATPFERRMVGQEVVLCQRYYYRWTNNNTAGAYFAIGRAFSASGGTVNVWFPTPMRTTPIFASSTVNSTNFDYGLTSLSASSTPGVVPGIPNTGVHSISLSATGSFSAYGVAFVLGVPTSNFVFLDFTAEL